MSNVGISLAVLILAAWGVGEGCSCQSFSIPAGATKVGDLDIYVVGEKVAVAPTPSTRADAPVIVGVSAVESGPYEFKVNYEVEGNLDITFAYVDFGAHGIYKVKVSAALEDAGGEAPTACGIAASQQGITCTPACLYACSCLVCPDAQVETNAEQSCAFTCTVSDNQGLLDAAPYYGSEKTFASRLYKGAEGVPGIAAQAGCNAGKCVSGPMPGAKRTKGWSITFATPTVPVLTPMFATQVADTSQVVSGTSGAPATVGIDKCGANRIC